MSIGPADDRRCRYRQRMKRYLSDKSPCRCPGVVISMLDRISGDFHVRPDDQEEIPFAGMVQQSRQSGHDRALSGALPELRPDPRGTAVRQAADRHRPDRLRPVALQPPSPRTGQARARGHRGGGRRAVRVPLPSDPGNRQAPDRRARPQPRLSQPGRGALRLSARRRRADHRLRQDHAGAADGGGHRQHPGDRAVGRADAQRLAQGQAHRLRHHRLGIAPAPVGRRDRLRRVHGHRRLLGAVGRLLQHDGHGDDDEFARRGARHAASGFGRHSRALPRARPDRLRDGQAHRRHGA